MSTDTKTATIAALNDRLRKTGFGGQLFISAGINGLPFADQQAIMHRVRDFEAFTEDNDPHGEHDFGAFSYEGRKVFWKIDYYDADLTYGSEDPSDPAKTTRVLTVMLAEEY